MTRSHRRGLGIVPVRAALDARGAWINAGSPANVPNTNLGTIFFLTEPNAHVVTIVATIAYKLWSSGMIPF